MARHNVQDPYDASDAKRRLPVNLCRPKPNPSASAPRPQLEQRRADVERYGQSGTEPALDEVLREPAIRVPVSPSWTPRPVEDPQKLRELSAWYRAYADRANAPWVCEGRLQTAEDLERAAAVLEHSLHPR